MSAVRLAILLVACSACLAHAQVPQLINYQGRVVVGAQNFDGTGQFKFALVDNDGTQTFWSNDGTSSAGSEPTASVSLAVSKGLYSVVLGETSLPNMTAIPHSVFENSDVRLRVWFNDGTHGSQKLTPDQRIAAVGYAVMAANVPNGSITAAKIADGAIGAAQLGNGAVTAGNLAAGAAAANLNASGQSGVGSGGVVLSTNANATELLNAGYVKLTSIESAERFRSIRNTPPGRRSQHSAVWTGSEMIVFGGINNNIYYDDGARYDPALDRWTPISKINSPSARFAHTAVWQPNPGKMIIWGGGNANGTLADGGVYDVASDTWTPIPVSPVISGRDYHSAVIIGNQMIVWGGTSLPGGGGALNTGGRLDLGTLVWTATSTGANSPSARYVHRAVSTGTEMIVWGGSGNVTATNTGARYNPSTDTWTAMATPMLAGRYAHSAIWTGTRMIVWGGVGSAFYSDGASYNPTNNTWSPLSNTSAPVARYYFSAIWTGSEMIVFGGKDSGNAQLGDGGRYDPVTDTWTPLPSPDFYARRWLHSAVWTGNEMIVWGGEYGGGQETGRRFNPFTNTWITMLPIRRAEKAVWTGTELIFWGGDSNLGNNSAQYRDDGLRWDSVTNTWRRIPPDPIMPARFNPTSVWDGSEMLVWGGAAGGGRYNPAGDGSWTAIPSEPAVDFRYGGSAIWTGSEMIFWGGSGPAFGQFESTGGRYDPVSDTWTVFNGDPAVPGRTAHTIVWTGSEMIVWGGYSYDNGFVFTYYDSGGRYNPASDQWTPTSSAGLTGRYGHSAVWTGNEMILWGGYSASTSFTSSDGARYNPVNDTWTLIQAPLGVTGRSGHSAVWTGSEMIIWGGAGFVGGVYSNTLFDGARYDPTGAGQWFPIAPNHAVGGRHDATAIWTGSEMIVASSLSMEEGNFAEVFSYAPPKTLYLYLRP